MTIVEFPFLVDHLISRGISIMTRVDDIFPTNQCRQEVNKKRKNGKNKRQKRRKKKGEKRWINRTWNYREERTDDKDVKELKKMKTQTKNGEWIKEERS